MICVMKNCALTQSRVESPFNVATTEHGRNHKLLAHCWLKGKNKQIAGKKEREERDGGRENHTIIKTKKGSIKSSVSILKCNYCLCWCVNEWKLSPLYWSFIETYSQTYNEWVKIINWRTHYMTSRNQQL